VSAEDSDQTQASQPDAEVTAPGIPSLASGPRLRAVAPSDGPPVPAESLRPSRSRFRPPVMSGKVGERLNGYQLLDEIARGGMGKIFLAVKVGSDGFRKVVTVKRLHSALLRDQDHVDMFIDEASISSHVSHPFVREVLDFGYENGAYFMVMEFLDGEPLSAVYDALITDNPAPRPARHADVVARIVADLCTGLHAIHQIEDGKGEKLEVVHRDVSPHNLFVLHDGTTRVADLGIAHAKGRRQQTAGRRLKGKLAYMAPEYLAQQECDPRADVWSVGVVLWELLSGKRLFKRSNEALTVEAVLEDAIVPPSAHDRSIDPALDRIVGKALQRDTANRHSSALELEHELESYLAKSAQPVTRSEIASWLGKLLPDSREHLRELVHSAKTTPLQPMDPRRLSTPADPDPMVPRSAVHAAVAGGMIVLFLVCYLLLR
jgi:eukaryotic-like serine/threonine-protein kinase